MRGYSNQNVDVCYTQKEFALYFFHMPIRTSARKSTPPVHTMSHSFEAYLKRAVTYHACAITVLWVFMLFFSFAASLTLLVETSRIDALENTQSALVQQALWSQHALQVAQSQLKALQAPVVPTATSTAAEAAAVVPVPPFQGDPSMSPSGTLDRGAPSPDGKRYAGYDDVTKGKLGIGVEIMGDPRIRHIVLFNPKTETSGAGTVQAEVMSVRWTNSDTISYDVLVKAASGTQKVETRTVQIFF